MGAEAHQQIQYNVINVTPEVGDGSQGNREHSDSLLGHRVWRWGGSWNRDAGGNGVKVVFEMNLEGCIVVYDVEKGRRSIPGTESSMFKGMES